MQGITVREGQRVVIGSDVFVLESIDFNSSKSFISYVVAGENGNVSDESVLHCGETVELLPDVEMRLARVTNSREPHVFMEFDTQVGISIKGE